MNRLTAVLFAAFASALLPAQEKPHAESTTSGDAFIIHPYFQNRQSSRRRAMLRNWSADKQAAAAVDAGLEWLCRHQSADGRWDAEAFQEACRGEAEKRCRGAGQPRYNVGLTGLALLAFLGRGITHIPAATWWFAGILPGGEHNTVSAALRLARWSATVAKGVRFLLSVQDGEGCFGERVTRFTYNHAIATQAIAEAYGMTRDDSLREPLVRAVNFIVKCQNPGLGWRYGVRNGDNDTSVTTWMTMALSSARAAGVPVPVSAFRGAKNWITRATDDDGIITYTLTQRSPNHGSPYSTTVMGTLAGLLAQPRSIDVHRGRLAKWPLSYSLLHPQPEWLEDASISPDIIHWHFIGLLCVQAHWHLPDNPLSQQCARWHETLISVLTEAQMSPESGCAGGSWPAVGAWSAAGGRIMTTALAILCLETCYRYAPISAEMFPRKIEEPTVDTIERVKELVAQLGSGDLAMRRKATALLVEMGETALQPLRQLKDNADAEVRLRVEAIIRRIEE